MYGPSLYVIGGYLVAFVTAFALALHQYYQTVFGHSDECDRELPEITYYPPTRIKLDPQLSSYHRYLEYIFKEFSYNRDVKGTICENQTSK